MKRTIIILFLIFTWILISYSQQQGADRFNKIINRLVEAMNKHDYAAIVQEYDSKLAVSFPLTNTTILFKQYESQYGLVTHIDSPQVKAIDQATCVIHFERGTQDLTIYLNDQDKINGFIFTGHTAVETKPVQESKPAAETGQVPSKPSPSISTTSQPPSSTAPSVTPSTSTVIKQPVAPAVTDKQQTELYPPFKGLWVVVNGGEVRDAGAQSNLLQQQFSYDFSASRDGSRYKNNGKANEDYFGYGKDVLSPAAGTVIEVIDGIRENSPGLRNPYAPIGNAVIIQHSSREYSVLSYLKQGSIKVKVGEKVTRGQVIAQCGNSGNAIEPLIHYHLQDSPYLQTAKGIKFYFERATVTKDGKTELKLNYLPGANEIINLE